MSPEAITGESASPETTAEDTQRVKALVTQIFDSRYNFGVLPTVEEPLREQLEAMPRKALITAAWQGIANYHRELTIWGETPRIKRLEEEKEYRKSLLSIEETEQAVILANDWLDDNFGK